MRNIKGKRALNLLSLIHIYIEIYVDGIATMQIQNLNALVDTVRHEIIERYRPGEDDPHLKVLQAAHISDDEYFSHMVLDLSLIHILGFFAFPGGFQSS